MSMLFSICLISAYCLPVAVVLPFMVLIFSALRFYVAVALPSVSTVPAIRSAGNRLPQNFIHITFCSLPVVPNIISETLIDALSLL